jgi:D-arabinose 5-phosphate isomerase GutQ
MGETRIIPALVKAIQEQQATIVALTARIEALENN